MKYWGMGQDLVYSHSNTRPEFKVVQNHILLQIQPHKEDFEPILIIIKFNLFAVLPIPILIRMNKQANIIFRLLTTLKAYNDIIN